MRQFRSALHVAGLAILAIATTQCGPSSPAAMSEDGGTERDGGGDSRGGGGGSDSSGGTSRDGSGGPSRDGGRGDTGDRDASSTSDAPPASDAMTVTGVSWVYDNGTYGWSGDWDSNLTSDYSFTPSGFSCVTGSQCISQTPSAEWAMWIPYPQLSTAAYPKGNPNDTLHTPGIGLNIDGYNYLTIAIYPTKPGFTPTFMIDYCLPGQVDLSAGNCVEIAGGSGDCPVGGAYGPSPMLPNQWNV